MDPTLWRLSGYEPTHLHQKLPLILSSSLSKTILNTNPFTTSLHAIRNLFHLNSRLSSSFTSSINSFDYSTHFQRFSLLILHTLFLFVILHFYNTLHIFYSPQVQNPLYDSKRLHLFSPYLQRAVVCLRARSFSFVNFDGFFILY